MGIIQSSKDIKEIKEWDDIIEVLGNQGEPEEQSEILFMVEEIEALVPGC